jgi:hypothetical protein
VRGFLRTYASYLGLEPAALLDQLPAPFAPPAVEKQPEPEPAETIEQEDRQPVEGGDVRPVPSLIEDEGLREPEPEARTPKETAVRAAPATAASMGRPLYPRPRREGAPAISHNAEGLLLERQPRQARVALTRRRTALAGGVVVAVLIVIGVMVAAGGGREGLSSLPLVGETRQPEPRTIIPVRTPTPGVSPSASPSPSASATEDATPEPEATAVPTEAATPEGAVP